MAVRQDQAALFARRLLSHHALDTQAKRMGKVIRISEYELTVWEIHGEQEVKLGW